MKTTDIKVSLAHLRQMFVERYHADLPSWIDRLLCPIEYAPAIVSTINRFFSTDGKVLRPLLLLTSWMMEDAKHTATQNAHSLEGMQAIPLPVWHIAIALERFHAALLVADDLFDHGEIRRGERALHLALDDVYPQSGGLVTIYLVTATMIELYEAIGQEMDNDFAKRSVASTLHQTTWDHLQSTLPNSSEQVFDFFAWVIARLDDETRLMEEAGLDTIERLRLWSVLSYCLNIYQITLEGEIEDIKQSFPRQHLPDDLVSLVTSIQYAKTSAYSIEFPLMIGGFVRARPKMRIGEYGKNLAFSVPLRAIAEAYGQLFQCHDDWLILHKPEEIGKDPMADLINGSLTIVTAAVSDLLPSDQRQWWSELLGQCKNEAARDEALEVIKGLNVFTYIEHHYIAPLVEQCRLAIRLLGETGYDTRLLEYIIFHGQTWIDDDRASKGS